MWWLEFCERIGVGVASAARGVHYVGGSRRLNQRRSAGLTNRAYWQADDADES